VEVTALLTTLRRHNATAGPGGTVAFWGLDSGYNAAGRSVLGPLLDTVDEDTRTQARHAFATLDELEPCWPFKLNEPEFTKPLREVHDVLNELDSALEAAGDTRYDADARRLLEMMRRWSGPQRHDRSRQMGATLVELIDRAPAECRVVVWAHNGHVGRGGDASAPNLGDVLSARFGSGYVPLAFEFGGGSVQLRRLDADLALGEVVATPVEPAPVGSLPWCLTTTGHSALAVDLREARANPILDSWLQERPTEHALGWHLTDSSHFSEPWRSPKTYDGVLFVRDSTPTHPTPNARRAFTNRERF
jgi:erythromycin esterase-like protein